MRVRTSSLVVLIAVALLGGARPAHADEGSVVAETGKPSSISAYRGLLAWSRWVPAEKQFRLVIRAADGTVSTAPGPGRSVPFDVDLGPDRHGRTTAVYSRCRVETPGSRISQGIGCDIYAYRLGARREHLLRFASRPNSSESQPTIFRNRLAFVRVFERRAGVAGVKPHIFLSAAGKTRQLRGGPDDEYNFLNYKGGRHPKPPQSGETHRAENLDLGAKRLTFTWSAETFDCPRGGEDPDGNLLTQVRQTSLTTGRTSIPVQGCTGDGSDVAVASVFGNELAWVSSDDGALLRARVGDTTRQTHITDGLPHDTAQDRDHVYLSERGSGTDDSESGRIVAFTRADVQAWTQSP